MKKITSLIFCITSLSTAFGQNLDGVWLSVSENNTTEQSNIFLDFNTNSSKSIQSNEEGKINVNKKQTKIKVDGFKGKLIVHKKSQNFLQLKGKKDLFSFNRLDAQSKIKVNKKELSQFIVEQFCGDIQGIKAQFTKEQYFLDKKSKKTHHRNQFINYTESDNGYWFIKKINEYAFLVLKTGENERENIFQITSLSLNGIKLKQLQNTNQIKNLTQVKTCL